MIEGEAIKSAMETNNEKALTIEANVQGDELSHAQAWQPIEKGAFKATSALTTLKQAVLTLTKNSIKMILCLVAGFTLFITIMMLSVYAFYLKLKQDKKN